jgi:hypothetical protein
MEKIPLTISKELIEKIAKDINGSSLSAKIRKCVKAGYYLKVQGIHVTEDYLALEELFDTFKQYQPPKCPQCDGILAQNSSIIRCLKCGKKWKAQPNGRT